MTPFDYLQNPNQAGQPGQSPDIMAGVPAVDPKIAAMGAPQQAFDYSGQQQAASPQTYTADQFNQRYTQHFGSGPSQNVIQQVGAAVGAPSADGTYSQGQWDTGWNTALQLGAAPGADQPFFPTFEAPTYEAGPAYQAPEKFQAPTMDQAMADPGYQFALKQGTQAITNANAAKGLARTGAAMKGLIDYGQQAASQQYDKVYNRAAQEYAQNYQMGRDTWGANQAARDAAWDRNYKGRADAHNSQFRAKELTFNDINERWRQNLLVNTQLALAEKANQ